MVDIFGPTDANVVSVVTLVATFALCMATLVNARRAVPKETGAKADPVSRLGIVVQGSGLAVAGLCIPRFSAALTTQTVMQAALVAGLMTAMIVIFSRARNELGTNWSFVARARDDHGLVTTGPFSRVRHPIYSALFLMMLAISTGMSNWDNLVLAVPLFIVGTLMRILPEERLLHERFGSAYAAYAARVPRFVPGLF